MAKTYKTGEACKVLDVQPYVLRYWETEFSALGAKKPGPHRVYSQAELTILTRIKELLYDEGYTIAGAKKRLEGELGDESSSGTSATAKPQGKGKEAANPGPSQSTASANAAADSGADSTEKSSKKSAKAKKTKAAAKEAAVKKGKADPGQAELAIDATEKDSAKGKSPAKKATSSTSEGSSGASLDSTQAREIETVQLTLRKLHKEAVELLEIVRSP